MWSSCTPFTAFPGHAGRCWSLARWRSLARTRTQRQSIARCVPRPRRPVLVARSLALTRSHTYDNASRPLARSPATQAGAGRSLAGAHSLAHVHNTSRSLARSPATQAGWPLARWRSLARTRHDTSRRSLRSPATQAGAGRSLAGAHSLAHDTAPVDRSRVPRPRRPVLVARSLALTRSHMCTTPRSSQNTGGTSGRPPPIIAEARRLDQLSRSPSWVTIQNSSWTDGVRPPDRRSARACRAVVGSSSWVGMSRRASASVAAARPVATALGDARRHHAGAQHRHADRSAESRRSSMSRVSETAMTPALATL